MGPGMMSGRAMMGRSGQLDESPADIDARLALLHDALAVTPAQEDAWSAYATAARADAQTMTSMHASMVGFMRSQATTAPDWLDIHRNMMRARVDALDTLAEAVDAFYAELSESQQATFDQYGGGLCGAW
jgi:hypothetical protein